MVAGVTTALAEARDELLAVVRAGLAPVLPAYRIHKYQPPKPAIPCGWLGPFGMQPDTVGDGAIAVVSLTGTITAIVDGRIDEQVAATDVLQSALWQAVNTIGDPTASSVGYIDVGGPLLFGVTMTFRMVVAAYSLCPLELITQEATP